jgi:ABC-2 type transport system ATP-binding protein
MVAASVRLIEAPGQDARRKAAAARQYQPAARREGMLLMDERSRGASTAPALLLDHVVKTYGPVRAVDGVSFTAHPGEFIALLGPNGAGKSTLFQLLSGLFVPDSGRIEVMGHDMTRKPVPALARLGIVFQQPTLDLELSVTSNLMFHAGLHGIPRAIAKARIEKELVRLGLADRAHDKTATLSGGNRRRVELARALLHEPRVLLMDEATVGLDPASRSDLLKLLLAMRIERAVAVLWATHLCDEVGDADRVIVMDKGKVLADTTPKKLVAAAGTTTIEQAFLAMTGAAAQRV